MLNFVKSLVFFINYKSIKKIKQNISKLAKRTKCIIIAMIHNNHMVIFPIYRLLSIFNKNGVKNRKQRPRILAYILHTYNTDDFLKMLGTKKKLDCCLQDLSSFTNNQGCISRLQGHYIFNLIFCLLVMFIFFLQLFTTQNKFVSLY